MEKVKKMIMKIEFCVNWTLNKIHLFTAVINSPVHTTHNS